MEAGREEGKEEVGIERGGDGERKGREEGGGGYRKRGVWREEGKRGRRRWVYKEGEMERGREERKEEVGI